MEKIYLDHASSMPVDSKVLEFAKIYLTKNFGNPSSLYSDGLEAKRALEESRLKIRTRDLRKTFKDELRKVGN